MIGAGSWIGICFVQKIFIREKSNKAFSVLDERIHFQFLDLIRY